MLKRCLVIQNRNLVKKNNNCEMYAPYNPTEIEAIAALESIVHNL